MDMGLYLTVLDGMDLKQSPKLSRVELEWFVNGIWWAVILLRDTARI